MSCNYVSQESKLESNLSFTLEMQGINPSESVFDQHALHADEAHSQRYLPEELAQPHLDSMEKTQNTDNSVASCTTNSETIETCNSSQPKDLSLTSTRPPSAALREEPVSNVLPPDPALLRNVESATDGTLPHNVTLKNLFLSSSLNYFLFSISLMFTTLFLPGTNQSYRI